MKKNEKDNNLAYITDDSYTKDNTLSWDNGSVGSHNLVDGRELDHDHRLNDNSGDEWYNVFIPGKDTLGQTWNGLHGIYNQGADITEDGTLSTQPNWDNAGVFYNSDNRPVDAPGTILEVLLTAAYMHDVVETHYNNGWTADGATEESKSDLFTYTMNVDTKHVPQWGKMRLYPTLDPKDYPLDTIKSEKWYTDTKTFGDDYLADEHTLTSVYEDLYDSWIAWKTTGETKATIADVDNNTKVQIKSIAKVGTNDADYETKLTKKDGTTQDDTIHVTDEAVIANIAYNDDFRGLFQMNNGKYRASITFQGKHYNLGYYDSFDRAVQARLDAEEVLHVGYLNAFNQYEEKAKVDPAWAEKNPFFYQVARVNGGFQVYTNGE